jgi:hypothetical protein
MTYNLFINIYKESIYMYILDMKFYPLTRDKRLF